LRRAHRLRIHLSRSGKNDGQHDGAALRESHAYDDGGYGYEALHRFYRDFFIPQMPKDTSVTPLSRTVGSDRVVDEIMFSFTHDVTMEWMIPGIAPTGRRVEIPLIAVVQFRGDKIYNEHIYWDQASLLAQLGVLDPTGLPQITGAEQAGKLTDQSLPSNALMRNWNSPLKQRWPLPPPPYCL